MLSPVEYAEQDAIGIANLVASGQVSELEVIDVAEQLCCALNPMLNAVVTPLFDHARACLPTTGSGILSGAPIMLKDEYQSVAGVPTSQAARLAEGWTRPYDTEIVKRYRRAGLQILGKTNLPEFGASITTEPVLTGRTNNPWDLQRNAGGSSGGSASAVAAGIVPVAYATDGAGSIRIPASYCGVFGLKPTRGRTPTGPDGGEYWNGLCIEHAISRSVRDSAALLDATDSAAYGAPYPPPAKARPYIFEVGADPGRLRIGFSTISPNGACVDLANVEAAMDAARLCEALGHHVSEASPTFDAFAMVDAMQTLLQVHLAFGIAEMENVMGRKADAGNIEAAHWQLAAAGRAIAAPQFLGALETLGRVARQAAEFWRSYDFWLTPTLAQPAPLHGEISANDPDGQLYLADYFRRIPFTPIANVTGNPAMSLPLGQARGLPIGVQFIGRYGAEDLLFRLASQLEAAAPWKSRRPPVSAWSHFAQSQA